MTVLRVFIPSEKLSSFIDRGSGVVGSAADTAAVTVDFEGNRFGAQNVVTFADRVSVASGRHLEKYPTVARMSVPAGELVRVGTFDMHLGVVDLGAGDVAEVQARRLVAHWCGLGEADVSAELRTTSHRDVLRRGRS